MITCDEIKKKIENQIPQSSAHVANPRGDDVHFSVTVTSPSFKGKSLIEQHRMVYGVFDNNLAECGKSLHALQIKTKIPENE